MLLHADARFVTTSDQAVPGLWGPHGYRERRIRFPALRPHLAWDSRPKVHTQRDKHFRGWEGATLSTSLNCTIMPKSTRKSIRKE